MKRIRLIVVTLFLIFILLVGEVLFVKSLSKYEPEISVIFTRQKIPANTVISESMLQTRKVNIGLVHPQSARNVNELIGKTALTDLEANEMVLSGRTGQVREIKEIEMENNDNRLFTVEFKPDQANGWWILVGQYVDIIFVKNDTVPEVGARVSDVPAPKGGKPLGIEPKNGADNEDDSKILRIVRLDNIRVAALIDEDGKLMDNSERESRPQLISFEVTPEQDEFLAWAKSNGRLEVSVRPVGKE